MTEKVKPEIVMLEYRLSWVVGYTTHEEWVRENENVAPFLAEKLLDPFVINVWVERHQYPFMQTEESGSLGERIYLKRIT